MYIRYIYKLSEIHLEASNLTEAGFTLLLHAELLEWSANKLQPENGYLTQPEWQRKEEIYLKIIDYFDRGSVSIYSFRYSYGTITWYHNTCNTWEAFLLSKNSKASSWINTNIFVITKNYMLRVKYYNISNTILISNLYL